LSIICHHKVKIGSLAFTTPITTTIATMDPNTSTVSLARPSFSPITPLGSPQMSSHTQQAQAQQAHAQAWALRQIRGFWSYLICFITLKMNNLVILMASLSNFSYHGLFSRANTVIRTVDVAQQ
jgi:hypothetical protein